MRVTEMCYRAKVEYERTYFVRPEQIVLSKDHWDRLKIENHPFMVPCEDSTWHEPEIYGMKIVVVDEYLPQAKRAV
jgi:hypothetical protein